MIVYNWYYYYHFDIYLGCHAIMAATNKNIYGYILRKIDHHHLESSDRLPKESEVGQGHNMKLKNEMISRTQIWSWFCSHLHL